MSTEMSKAEETAQAVVDEALKVHRTLQTEADLSPRNAVINQTLSNFYLTVIKSYSEEEESLILEHPVMQSILKDLLAKLAMSETAMEYFYAERLLKDASLRYHSLSQFIYWNNYERLIQLELSVLQRLLVTQSFSVGQSLAFVGSGALPLTAIIIAVQFHMPVTCIDCDAQACSVSSKLMERLSLGEACKVVNRSGQSHNYSSHPVVLIASLVPNKAEVVLRVTSTAQPGGLVLIRSVDGVRRLLYEPLDEQQLLPLGLTCMDRTRPANEIINCTVFFSF